ncbi:MAG: hypothetical protein E3J43_06660 [Candidatus Heimdallarchaeota archaeon]|nr:MAG: hypothetical protein E3J43_06660 [Candidatus Heimdallarchaeota archaeon]
MTERIHETNKNLEEIVSFIILMTGEYPKHCSSYILEKWRISPKGSLDLKNQALLREYYDRWVF